MAQDFTFVVFGGTGDLAKRKLAPAFANLLSRSAISEKSVLIGVARGDFTDNTYKKLIVDSAKKDKDKKALKKLKIKFFRGDASKPETLSGLSSFIKSNSNSDSKKLFYLATSFKLFIPIVKELKNQSLNLGSKIIFEKPFGNSSRAAKEIEEFMAQSFGKQDIYRIDHYLGKETVQNIKNLKFQNVFFEPLLNKRFVESIEVIASEDMGVGERLGYYHESGAIKDMVQNHLLQVLSLVLMDRPETSFHEKKIQALKSLSFDETQKNIIGHYIGYRDEVEKNNLPRLKTETFARLFFKSDAERWKGTKFILQTGKLLHKKEGKIIINFKTKGHEKNKIIINIFPTQDVHIHFNTRVPGTGKLDKAVFDFCHECKFGPNTIDEYAVLLEESIKGNTALFPSSAEILESWRIIEQINKNKIKFVQYAQSSNPEEIN
ncbi:MAG TPA: hypothetical protein VHA12_00935 [Candidatus Nanoarchaeia archaeon]|nr:hypothetical protein [Candidatus Nanoarchaeia archaeon]